MKFYLVYSTKTGHYYISFENDLKDRLIYFDADNNHFYKDGKRKTYLTVEQEARLNDFRNS